jgi:hypothetical protein
MYTISYNKKHYTYIIILAMIIIASQACATYYFRQNYQNTNALLHDVGHLKDKPFLKAHLKNGDVCILRDRWTINTQDSLILGDGSIYDFNRELKYSGKVSFSFDSIAILETNTKITNPEQGRITALTILTGVDVLVGLFCLTNPKACFGSCPTFYLNELDDFHHADAEGFSNAILPSMEYADIDALNNGKIADKNFTLTMKNEALETHCVNEVKLLAVPRNPGERIFQSPDNAFYICNKNYPMNSALASEGDIKKLIKNQDRTERFSLADKDNLSSKEEIILTFNHVDIGTNIGLVTNFRQTLLTTYLFYSAMGYMGKYVSDIFALLETDDKMKSKFDATTKELGGIEVFVLNNKTQKWELQGTMNETGPIAINKQLIPFKASNKHPNVKVKLVLNKGLWRIDYVALTRIVDKVQPIEINPVKVLNKGNIDTLALNNLLNPSAYLISMPGSAYKLSYTLPNSNTDYELFLKSKGYYLEWMRSHWIKDENITKLKQMVNNPKRFLKEEAKNFKKYETSMEDAFWNSKIDTKNFSYYEN